MAARTEVPEVDEEVVNELRRRAVGGIVEARGSQRAKLILLHLDRVGVPEIARRVGLSRMRVYDWIGRFEREGLEGS